MNDTPKVQTGPDKLVIHCYPWFIADWLQSEHVAAMSLEERGLYREVLDLCYANGSVPDDATALQKLTRSTEKEFRRAWPKVKKCFLQDGDRLRNAKVDAVLDKERSRRDKARESGSAGGRAKAEKGKREPSKPSSETPSEPRSKQPSENVATLQKKPSEIVAPHPHPHPHPPPQTHPPALPPDELANVLSDRHRKKGDRGLIGAAIVDIIVPLPEDKQKQTLALINSRHSDWCSREWSERDVKFIPKLSNWLREGGWRDDPPNGTEDYESKLPPLHDGSLPE